MAKEDGTFLLRNIPPGKYDLTISSVGYKLVSLPFALTEGGPPLVVKMDPEVNLLNEVVIKSKKENRSRYLRIFKEQFLGGTSNSSLCRIRNEDKIDFDFDKETFLLRAFCAEPIEVENSAMGYRVFYVLTKFEAKIGKGFYKVSSSGVPRFEELTPRDENEAKRWQRERERAYRGSMNHLMRSLARHELSENDFLLYIRRKGSDNDVHEGKDDFQALDESYVMSSRPDSLSTLKIIYVGEVPDWNYPRKTTAEISYLYFRDKGLVIHSNGYFDNFEGFDIAGYLGWTGGIAELVPLEFQPETAVELGKQNKNDGR